MAPHPRTPPQKMIFTLHKMIFLSSLYTYVKNLHLWHTRTENSEWINRYSHEKLSKIQTQKTQSSQSTESLSLNTFLRLVFFFMILVMHRKRGKDEHKYFILPSPQSFNSAPSDLYRWSTMFETSSDNFNNLLHELHSRKSTSVCYIDWHDILFLLYFDEFFHDN